MSLFVSDFKSLSIGKLGLLCTKAVSVSPRLKSTLLKEKEVELIATEQPEYSKPPYQPLALSGTSSGGMTSKYS